MDTKKNIDYYLNLKWSYTIEQEFENGNPIYIIKVNELPGVCTDARNLEEGMKNIKEAIAGCIELYLKNGEEVPEPITKDSYKGKISYRTTQERHYNIVKIAKRNHQSISKTVDRLIDEGLKHTEAIK